MKHGRYKSYKVLREIRAYFKRKTKHKNYKPDIIILTDDFFDKSKYGKNIVNEILVDLANHGYIQDTYNQIRTEVHAVKITDKGKDALRNIFSFMLC